MPNGGAMLTQAFGIRSVYLLPGQSAPFLPACPFRPEKQHLPYGSRRVADVCVPYVRRVLVSAALFQHWILLCEPRKPALLSPMHKLEHPYPLRSPYCSWGKH